MRFNRVENEEEGRAIFHPDSGGRSLFTAALWPFESARPSSVLFHFIPGFVAVRGNAAKALSGAVSSEGKSLGGAGANPIVFSPM